MPDDFAPPLWLGCLALGVLGLGVAVWSAVYWRFMRGSAPLARRRLRRPPWGWEGAILAGLYLFSAVFAALSAGPAPADEAEPIAMDLELVASQLAIMTLFSATALALIVARHRPRKLTLRDFGLGWGATRTAGDIATGVAAAAAMLPLVYAVNLAMVLITGDRTPHPAIESLMGDPTGHTLLATAILAVVAAPLFEEFAFRVLLQGGLQRVAGKHAWWPVAASAVAFGLAHAGHGVAPVAIVVLALGLGYVYRQTHSFAAVVAMHMAFNSVSLSVAYAALRAGAEL
ncbi:CPBP family intramembrane glutamic endopeptidase [Botrimarina sp.]|uniref:CPBP family intramembrane glutamic endopeptidase n=1 Tax=Botrimarina sp. TaxID=2795802 RepID=UPI0032EA9B5A